MERARLDEAARDVHGVLRLRRRLGIGQIEFANRYRLALGTLATGSRAARSPTSRPRSCSPRSRPTRTAWRLLPRTPATRATSPPAPGKPPERTDAGESL